METRNGRGIEKIKRKNKKPMARLYQMSGFKTMEEVENRDKDIFNRLFARVGNEEETSEAPSAIPSARLTPLPRMTPMGGPRAEQSRESLSIQQRQFRTNYAGILNSEALNQLAGEYPLEKLVKLNENIAPIKKQLAGRTNLDAKFFNEFIGSYFNKVEKSIKDLNVSRF